MSRKLLLSTAALCAALLATPVYAQQPDTGATKAQKTMTKAPTKSAKSKRHHHRTKATTKDTTAAKPKS